MGDDFQSPTPGSTVAADAPATSQTVAHGQPEFFADSKLAGILEKKSRGEKLSASDRGYLGAVKRKGTPKTVSAPANPNPLLEAPANPDNPLFEGAAKTETPAGGAPAAAVDSALIRRTADALLSSLDTGTKLYIGYEAKQSGADKQTVDDYKAAVALQPENRQLMVENSEPVVLKLCEIFGCTPDKLESVMKNSGFAAGMIAHGIGVIAAVKSIRESKKERAATSQQPANT